MDDLISRQALLDEIKKQYYVLSELQNEAEMQEDKDYYEARIAELFGCVAIVSAALTVDAEPVRHGYWQINDDNWSELTECLCSACHEQFTFEMYDSEEHYLRYKYCPNCGAKMDAKEDE